MKYILLFMIVFLSSGLSAQVTYVMQNASVTDCEGILTDSDMGEEEGQYAHEEDYTFTICVDGADEIIVVFDFFASEAQYDILTVYDGPNINSPVIATLSGILQPAPTLIATSGCITFRFVTDDNIAAIGWSASWTTNITTPPTPMMTLVGTPVCPLMDQIFRFDRPVPCDLIIPGNFTLLGPGGGAISTVTPLNCDPQTGMATEFRVTFNPPASVQGNYRLLFSADIQDACGRVHPVSSNVLFQLANCPMSVYIEFPDGPVCEGQCTAVRAVVSNGNPVGRTFQWSHSPVNAAQTQICSVSPTLISVTVTDNPGGQTATAEITYTPWRSPKY
ncbi:MAG: CUB domain-containing protein [Saprospiraceae bacterium]|nr:CUB domain-containing protein [Saprospiraceae bacterium]